MREGEAGRACFGAPCSPQKGDSLWQAPSQGFIHSFIHSFTTEKEGPGESLPFPPGRHPSLRLLGSASEHWTGSPEPWSHDRVVDDSSIVSTLHSALKV